MRPGYRAAALVRRSYSLRAPMHIHLLDLNAGVENRGTPALLAVFAQHGANVQRYEVRRAGELPADEEGIWVLGGGPGSPFEPGPWREPLLARLRHRVAESRPTLGICFGYELMGLALGAEVRPLREERGGIYPLSLVDTGGHWAHLAGEHVYEKRSFGVFGALPAEAEVLALGPEGDVAAMRVGPAILGVIFHPEADLGPETAAVFSAMVPGFLAAVGAGGVSARR